MREQQDQADDQGVNGQGFDEGQTKDQGNGDLTAGLGVAGSAFAGALEAETHADAAAESSRTRSELALYERPEGESGTEDEE